MSYTMLLARRCSPVRGAFLLEGLIALFLAFTVGFALTTSLLQTRKLLRAGQDDSLALDVMGYVFRQASVYPFPDKGDLEAGGRHFHWTATRRVQPGGWLELEATVFWKDSYDRPRSVNHIRSFRDIP